LYAVHSYQLHLQGLSRKYHWQHCKTVLPSNIKRQVNLQAIPFFSAVLFFITSKVTVLVSCSGGIGCDGGLYSHSATTSSVCSIMISIAAIVQQAIKITGNGMYCNKKAGQILTNQVAFSFNHCITDGFLFLDKHFG
jgi:hypothetical protein